MGTGEGPLSIWVVTDGRAGIENQALGLAEAVAHLAPAEITVKRVQWRRWMRRLPSRLNLFPRAWLGRGSDPVAQPWPDLWIGNGRASIPLSIAVRRWSGGRTFVVQLQDPLRPAQLFDLVIPPRHDGLEGAGVFAITGSPHRVTSEKLAAELARFHERIEPLPRPRIAVLIGGKSRAFDISPLRAETLAAALNRALDESGGSLMLTFSRRTPEVAKAILTERLAERPGWTWDGEGENPYFAFLASADAVVVTEDSINMVAEAASTGAPVHIARIDGAQDRKRRFYADLAQRGIARPFEGRIEHWTYQPLRETERAAGEVLRRLRARVAESGRSVSLVD